MKMSEMGEKLSFEDWKEKFTKVYAIDASPQDPSFDDVEDMDAEIEKVLAEYYQLYLDGEE